MLGADRSRTFPLERRRSAVWSRKGCPKLSDPIPASVVLLSAADADQDERLIRAVIERTGLMINTGQEVAFILQAKQQLGYLHYKNLRMFGEPLPPHAVKALGLRGNTRISREFLAVLSEQGLSDILHAGHVIAHSIEKALHTLRDLRQIFEVGGAASQVIFRASVTAAGPCAPAGEFDGQTMPIMTAPILPMSDCDRPGECCCLLQFGMPDYR
jgi:hypothetical protein